MKRLIDWQRRFNEYLASIQNKEFEWGKFDCCTFAGDAVFAITGEDPIAEFRGLYSNRLEAAQVLRDKGAGTLFATLQQKFGEPVRGVFGKRGDVAVFENNLGLITGRNGVFLIEDLPGRFLLISVTKIEYVFVVPFNG